MRRRRFLRNLAVGAAFGPLAVGRLGARTTRTPLREQHLRILVLGGTNFVGPHVVRAALGRGHRVTLFNRGYTNPDLFPGVERLTGNRVDHGADLEALRGGRTWDLVVDTWKYQPGSVNETARLLAGRVGGYVYISSIAVYRSFGKPGLDENSPPVEAAEHVGSHDPELSYPVRKRAGELATLRYHGDRSLILRCSSIYGYDSSASPKNQQSYWPLRFLSGEPVLVPEDPDAVLQWTDARDIGSFIVHGAEKGLGGIFNLVSPSEPRALADYLRTWHQVTGRRSEMVPASRTLLTENGVRPWVDLPVWIPADDPEPGFFRVDGERARVRGFPPRPLGETLRDVARTYGTAPAPEMAAEGMDRRRELELLWALER